MSENINLLEYGYAPDQKVTIDILGNQLLGLMHLLNAVVQQERHVLYLDEYPMSSEPSFVEVEGEKKLDAIDIQWEAYPNAASFYNQRPTTGLTDLGARALDLLNPIRIMHKELIEDGTAKKQTEDL